MPFKYTLQMLTLQLGAAVAKNKKQINKTIKRKENPQTKQPNSETSLGSNPEPYSDNIDIQIRVGIGRANPQHTRV